MNRGRGKGKSAFDDDDHDAKQSQTIDMQSAPLEQCQEYSIKSILE